VPAAEVEKNDAGQYVLKSDPSVVLESRTHKMSKSRGNVINPDHVVNDFGADALRVYEMFMGPLEATKPWSTSGIQGVRRFLDRVYEVTRRADGDTAIDEPLARLLHKTIRTVTEHIEQMRFNTAISQMMVLTNELMKRERVPAAVIETFAQLLHPYAPHLGEEMWSMVGRDPSIQAAPWPAYDPKLVEDSEVEVPVQVNGKMRGKLVLPKEATEAQALEAAKGDPKVAAHLEGKTLRKTIWVPGKILNLIAK
jgi:leucyl-tRNA synthetase